MTREGGEMRDDGDNGKDADDETKMLVMITTSMKMNDDNDAGNNDGDDNAGNDGDNDDNGNNDDNDGNDDSETDDFSQQNHLSVQRIMKMLTISLMIMKNVKDNKVRQLQSYK